MERFKLRAEACSSLQASVNFTNVPFLHTQRESTWTHAHLQYSRCWMNPISHASTTATAAKPKPPIIYHWPITIRQSVWTRQPRPIRERFTRQIKHTDNNSSSILYCMSACTCSDKSMPKRRGQYYQADGFERQAVSGALDLEGFGWKLKGVIRFTP